MIGVTAPAVPPPSTRPGEVGAVLARRPTGREILSGAGRWPDDATTGLPTARHGADTNLEGSGGADA